jgi:hypothetical protein
MKEKEERKYRRGVLVEKKRRRGGLGQKAIFFPWLAPRTEVGGARAAASHRREGKKKEGDEGFLLPPSPWARVRCGGGFPAGGGLEVASLGGGAPVLKQGEKVAVVVRGSPGGGRHLFIGGLRRFGRGFFLSSRSFDVRQWRWKYPSVDPSGEVLGRDSRRGVNAAMWDGTGRPATRWWQAAGRGGVVGWRRRLGQVPRWPPGVRERSRRGPVLEQ